MELPEKYPTGKVGQETQFYVGNMVLNSRAKPAAADLEKCAFVRSTSRRLVLDQAITIKGGR